jgi:integrase
MPRQATRRQSKKRANGEGTITQRKDGRWQAAVYGLDGSRKFYYGATREDVAEKLVGAAKAVQDGLPLPDERVTLAEYLDLWLAKSRDLGSIRRSTWVSYESYVRLHLKPALGRVPLAHLTPAHVQKFMAEKLRAGASPRAVRYCRVILRAALNQAVKQSLIVRNSAALTDPPKGYRPQHASPLTPDEGLRFIAGLEDERLKALHLLMLALGLRQGEALGLRWPDVDLEEGVVRVRVELVRLDSQYTLEDLKTEKSQRDLPLDEYLVAALRVHRTKQNEEQLAAETWSNDFNLVFTTKNGQPVHPSVATNDFQRILTKLGIPTRRHYDLRHSAASYLIHQGAELRDVMEQLGHSQISLTANTYGHLFMERKRQLAAGMAAFLKKATPAG